MNHITHSRKMLLFFLTGYDFHCDECTIGQIIKQKLHKRRIHCALRGGAIIQTQAISPGTFYL